MAANVKILSANKYEELKRELGVSYALAEIRTDMGTSGRLSTPEARVLSKEEATEKARTKQALSKHQISNVLVNRDLNFPVYRVAYISDVHVVKTINSEDALLIRGCGPTRERAIASYYNKLLAVKGEMCLVVGKTNPIKNKQDGTTALWGKNLRRYQIA